MSFHSFLKRHEKVIGATASTLSIIMFVSLIEVFLSNYRGESHIFIQPLAASISGFVWLLYAYARKDWFIALPNIFALILGIATAMVAFM